MPAPLLSRRPTDPSVNMLIPRSTCTSRLSSLGSALGLSCRAPVGVWDPLCSLTVLSFGANPTALPTYLPVGRLHLGLKLSQK